MGLFFDGLPNENAVANAYNEYTDNQGGIYKWMQIFK